MTSHDTGYRLRKLLAPSWLSGLLGIVAPLAFEIGTATDTFIHKPAQYTVLAATQQTATAAADGYALFAGWIGSHALTRNLPLAAFWAAAGLAAFFVVSSLVKGFSDLRDLESELRTTPDIRHAALRVAAGHLLARLAGVCGMAGVLWYTIHTLLPAGFGAARAVAVQPTLNTILQAAALTAALSLSWWVQTIFLRLAVLRVRVFGTSILS